MRLTTLTIFIALTGGNFLGAQAIRSRESGIPPAGSPPLPLAGAAIAKATPIEKLVTFNADTAEFVRDNKQWILRSGEVIVKDLGRRETEAREALRIIRDLHLTQYGAVGTPRPIMEYWLSNGQAPQNKASGLHTVGLDLPSLRVEQVQNQWCLRDGERNLFTFGAHEDEAREALAIIQRYGFTHVGFVGLPNPVMIYFLAGTGRPDRFAGTQAVPRTVERIKTGRGQSKSEIGNSTGVAPAVNTSSAFNSKAQGMLPIGRQLNSPSINAQGLGNINERIPLDWRQVRVQQDGQNWKLVYAGYVLADFGKNEPEAKRALGVVQHYRFSEQCLVGRPKPSLTYYLVGGQAPRGVLIGVNATSFQPDTLSLQWRGNKWAIVDGYRPLMEFGDKPEEAKQAMQAIKQQKFDTICRVGASDAPGMTFLVRTR